MVKQMANMEKMCSFKLSEELYDMVKEQAKREFTSLNTVYRKAIYDYCQRAQEERLKKRNNK